MSTEARAALELSKEGRNFLEILGKCSDLELAASLVEAGARLLTVGASGKENVLSGPAAPALTSALLTLKGLSLINPRGRFDLTFAKEALCLTSAKVNIVIPTTLLTHVAIIDQIPQDTKKRCLVFLVLDRHGQAVMNGKQRLEVVIIQTMESDTISTRSAAGELLEGPVAAVLCQAVGMCIPNFTSFLAPDTDLYKSARGHIGVNAVVKVNSGHLFPLPGAVLFAERPTVFVPLRDVLAVEYRRPESVTFDLVLHTRAPGRGGEDEGPGSVQQIEFSQIDRGELGRLQSYFSASKVKLYDAAAPPRLGAGPGAPGRGGAQGAGTSAGAGLAEEYDEDEDEDEDDEDFDPTALERLEAGRRPAKRARTEPSASVAASNLPGAGAGPSSSRAVEEEVEGASGDEDDEEDDEDEDDDDDYDDEMEEDELADLTDEEDLRADDVRQRVGRTGTSGRGAGATAGKGAAAARRGRSPQEEEDEDDDEFEDDH